MRMTSTSSLPDALPGAELWKELGWNPDPDQGRALVRLQSLLRDWNRRCNLTRLVEGEDYWISQVFDSLWPMTDLLTDSPAPALPPLSLIDVGTGGGFPGLALAIALPAADLTLVDSVGRKIRAVEAMATDLGLHPRVHCRCERIERLGQTPGCRGGFDWATARAVARAPVVAEYLVPLLKPGGRALLYRGQWSEQDQRDLERTAAVLGAVVESVQRRDLPCGRGVRHAVRLRVVSPCPESYPRAVGVPLRDPLPGGA